MQYVCLLTLGEECDRGREDPNRAHAPVDEARGQGRDALDDTEHQLRAQDRLDHVVVGQQQPTAPPATDKLTTGSPGSSASTRTTSSGPGGGSPSGLASELEKPSTISERTRSEVASPLAGRVRSAP